MDLYVTKRRLTHHAFKMMGSITLLILTWGGMGWGVGGLKRCNQKGKKSVQLIRGENRRLR
jgi:hypothetical protein